MAIMGQFGRAITGSSSMASAIAGIAQDFANLRIDRIYNAFINGTEFEGGEMTAQRAISLLSGMLSDINPEGKIASTISDTIILIRKSNRAMVLNKIDAELEAAGYEAGDFGNKVQVIKEMLLDRTLSTDDRSELQSELNVSVEEYIKVIQEQMFAGSKAIVNGVSVDFSIESNYETALAEFDRLVELVPASAEKITREKNLTSGLIAMSKANAIWNAMERTNDKTKLEGYKEQLKTLRPAYEELKRLGLEGDPVAERMIEIIRTIEGNEQTVQDNIGREAASKRVANQSREIWKTLDAVDSAIRKDPGIGMPSVLLRDLLGSNPNFALSVIDEYIKNSGNNYITTPGGKRIEITRDSVYDMIVDAKNEAKSLHNFAQGNSFVTAADKNDIRQIFQDARGLVAYIPMLKTEDAYDLAKETLTDALQAAGGDINKRANALRSYADALSGIANQFPNATGAATALLNEARLFRSGNYVDGSVLYGVWSGNAGESGYTNESLFGMMIGGNSTTAPTSVLDALATIYDERERWNNGDGNWYEDPLGDGSYGSAGIEDISKFTNGDGMRISKAVNVEIFGASLAAEKDSIVKRYRIVTAGAIGDASDKSLMNNTVGWVAAYEDAAGNIQYILTRRNTNQATVEYVISSDVAASLIEKINLDRSGQIINSRLVYVVSDALKSEIADADVYNTPFTYTDLYNGGQKLKDALIGAGYSIYDDVDSVIQTAFKTAIRNNQIQIRNGRIFANSTGAFVDITDKFTPNMLKKIIELTAVTPMGGDTGSTEFTGGETKPSGDYGTERDPEVGYSSGGAPGGRGPIGTGRGGGLSTSAIGEFERRMNPENQVRKEQMRMQEERRKRELAAAAEAKKRAASVTLPTNRDTAWGSGGYLKSIGVNTGSVSATSMESMLGTFMRNVPKTTVTPGTGVTSPVVTKPKQVVTRRLSVRGTNMVAR